MSFNVRNTDPADQFTAQQRKSYILQVITDDGPDIAGPQEIAFHGRDASYVPAWFGGGKLIVIFTFYPYFGNH